MELGNLVDIGLAFSIKKSVYDRHIIDMPLYYYICDIFDVRNSMSFLINSTQLKEELK